MKRPLSLAILTLSLPLPLACGSDSKAPAPSTGQTGTALEVPAAADGLQLVQQFGPLAAGNETHYCQYFVLPDHPIDVQRFQHLYTQGGHHIILYPTKLTAADAAAKPGAFDCEEIPTRGESGFAYVGGGTANSTSYPDGVAWHFEANEVVLLESHMLNLGTDPIDVDYRLNLWFAKAPVKDHVGTIFFYDNTIYIPASGQYKARMDCAIPTDLHILSLAPHMHVRGVHFESNLTGGSLTAPMPLVATDDWAALEPKLYEPTLDVTNGQRIQFSCDYTNHDAHPVVEGGSKTDNEMCLLIGSYYPKQDFSFEFCNSGDSGPVFSGTKTCGEASACFVTTPDPVEQEKCVSELCEGGSKAYDTFFSCVAQKCFFQGQCQGDPQNAQCNACAAKECAPELTACQNTPCSAP